MGKSTERPVQYTETAGLDVYKVDILFYLGFGKAFDGLYRGAVDFKRRYSKRV